MDIRAGLSHRASLWEARQRLRKIRAAGDGEQSHYRIYDLLEPKEISGDN